MTTSAGCNGPFSPDILSKLDLRFWPQKTIFIPITKTPRKPGSNRRWAPESHFLQQDQCARPQLSQPWNFEKFDLKTVSGSEYVQYHAALMGCVLFFSFLKGSKAAWLNIRIKWVTQQNEGMMVFMNKPVEIGDQGGLSYKEHSLMFKINLNQRFTSKARNGWCVWNLTSIGFSLNKNRPFGGRGTWNSETIIFSYLNEHHGNSISPRHLWKDMTLDSAPRLPILRPGVAYLSIPRTRRSIVNNHESETHQRHNTAKYARSKQRQYHSPDMAFTREMYPNLFHSCCMHYSPQWQIQLQLDCLGTFLGEFQTYSLSLGHEVA